VGIARREKTDEQFANELKEAVSRFSRRQPIDEAAWGRLSRHICYHATEFHDSEGYATLADRLAQLDEKAGTRGNRLFYLATPPDQFPVIIGQLQKAGLSAPASGSAGWTRIIIEKPFGRDLASARALDRTVHNAFDENQVYRIDHYLGKETVQNILVFRLGNGFFEPLWNSRYVDHVQMTVAESVGVEGRSSYYESAGVARDMLQSHILQLLTLLAMEPPATLAANAVRDEKVKVLRALRPLAGPEVRRFTVRGQYTAGAVGGARVLGYREEPGVAPDSTTATYLALKMEIDNWRWAGTPFYLRVGKRLPRRATEVAITFKAPPLSLFKKANVSHAGPNVLGIKIQPDEGIYLAFSAKAPGTKMHLDSVRMDFHYATSFGIATPEAYERLILDAIAGDATLFARTDEVELSWEWVDRILNVWENDPHMPLSLHPAGTEGPIESDVLLQRDGRRWRSI
jgi:glucose-6-phosphate 1-dehydrogenase